MAFFSFLLLLLCHVRRDASLALKMLLLLNIQYDTFVIHSVQLCSINSTAAAAVVAVRPDFLTCFIRKLVQYIVQDLSSIWLYLLL